MINWIKTWIQKRKMIKAQKKYGGLIKPVEDKSLVSENDKEKLVLDMDRIQNVMNEGSYITIRQNLADGILEINCTRGTVKDGVLEATMKILKDYNKHYREVFPLEQEKKPDEPREDKKEGYQ